MSEVTPSDAGYYYNAKSLSDLEDEVKADAQHLEKKTKEAEEAREKKEGEALRKKDRELQSTTDSIRDDSKEAYVRDRDREREEIGRMKAQNYDRFGRSGGESASDLKQQVESLKEAYEKQGRQDAERLARSDRSHEKKQAELARDNLDERNRATQTVRDSAATAFDEHVQGEKRAFRTDRDQVHATYDQRDRERTEELGDRERYLNDEFRKQQEGFRYSTDRVRNAAEKEIHNAQERAAERSQSDAKAMQKSHNEQTQDLRDKLSSLVFAEKDYVKEKGQARAEAIREHEDEARTFQRLQEKKASADTEDLKRQLEDTTHSLNRRNNEMMAEKNAFYTGTMKRQMQEAHDDARDQQSAFTKDHSQQEALRRQDRELSEMNQEHALEQQDAQHSKALAAQAAVSNDALKRQRQSDLETQRSLQTELEKKVSARTSADVSPAAEERTRQTFLKEYSKSADVERSRNEELVGSLQRNARERYNELLEAKESNETRLHQQGALERDLDRTAFSGGLQEAQMEKEAALRGADQSHQREVDLLSHNHATTIEHQRRDYEQMIEALRDDASAKQSAIRQNADFNSRMATRAFSAKQNELIREYEKKLADQKSDYDSQIDDLKTVTQQQLHEKDRMGRQALEEQGRSYEQRLAQLEAQHKERERLLSDNYSDELEKVKRSNALLIQKKG